MNIMRHTAYFCLLTLYAPLMEAQEVRRGSWNQVAALTTGQRIEIHPFDGKRVRGRFRASDAESVSIDANKDIFTVKRADVRLLKVRRASGRVRNAGLGAAIGGGIGGGVTAGILHGDLDDSLAVAIILVMAVAGASAGFAIGLIPAAYNTLYEAQRP